jgi:hypothetical protein
LTDAVIAELFSNGGVQAMNTLMRGFVADEHPIFRRPLISTPRRNFRS